MQDRPVKRLIIDATAQLLVVGPKTHKRLVALWSDRMQPKTDTGYKMAMEIANRDIWIARDEQKGR